MAKKIVIVLAGVVGALAVAAGAVLLLAASIFIPGIISGGFLPRQ